MDKWKPYIKKHSYKDECISVVAMKNGKYCIIDEMTKGEWTVYPPNCVERILWITLDDKVNRARKSCQRFCDKLNKKEKEIYTKEKEVERYLRIRGFQMGDKL